MDKKDTPLALAVVVDHELLAYARRVEYLYRIRHEALANTHPRSESGRDERELKRREYEVAREGVRRLERGGSA